MKEMLPWGALWNVDCKLKSKVNQILIYLVLFLVISFKDLEKKKRIHMPSKAMNKFKS